MIFEIRKVSSLPPKKPCKNVWSKKNKCGYECWYVEINTLEDLAKLEKEVKHALILRNIDSSIEDEDCEPSITIYDDYIE